LSCPSLSRSLSLRLTFVVGLTASGCSTLFPGSSTTSEPATTTSTGCTAAAKHVAPGGYYVVGNTVCTADGHAHLFHGVDRPSLEWGSSGENITLADFQLMASWKANSVRIALNQDFWLEGSKYYDAGYASRVDSAVHWAEDAGLDVILDLHWSDRGVLGGCDPSGGCQQVMADANSITFWSQVASRYSGDGRVLFELYNEPHDVPWSVWKSGGMSGGFQVAGMQQLYDAVRGAGADNLVVVGGLSWAYDLSGVPDNRISGYNIMYATHPYNNNPASKPGGFDAGWGFLTKTDPVIVTEFGDGGDCGTGADPYGPAIDAYVSAVITYADQHNASWTAWAWFPGGCKFPALINDWTGTPTPPGAVVKSALAGYGQPAPGGKRDAGAALDAGSDAAPATSGDGGAATGDGGKPGDASAGG
jgi:endoglucanase